MTDATTQLGLFAEHKKKDLPLKDDRVLMEYPFFGLQKKPLMKPIVYKNGDIELIIEPGPRGIATIWDKEILIYLASILNERIERGEPTSRTIQFVASDFLKLASRGTGKRSYQLLLDALDRLRNTSIRTTIASNDVRERRGFGWIETWRALESRKSNGQPIMVGIEITLSDWIFRAITHERRVLTLDKRYFLITKGLDRRLYELARKHCGKQSSWSISLSNLKDKCGSNREIRRFKSEVVKLVEKNDLPEYTMELLFHKEPVRCQITFRPRKRSKPVTKDENPDASGTFLLRAETLEQARLQCPDYDVHHIEQEWQAWAKKKHQAPPKDPDRAFLSFCDRYKVNNPL
ncbi:MAG: replication initiator protein A [Leptolyngbya sp. SIOISBB]|nr:replication initiator protein A [Leptolyngbya sp. SIOISBB]